MKLGRGLLDSVLSRALFVVGVLGVISVIAGHGVTLDRGPAPVLRDGPTVQQVVVLDDGAEVLSAPATWVLDLAEVVVAAPIAPPDHCQETCAAFLSSGTLLLLGWAAGRLISAKRQISPRCIAMHAAAAGSSGGRRILSPVKHGILRI
ncbi:hypothetical protein [Kribbella sp. CA-293567]|uniref:hypothetical protein n=1 Tax=Kribbella sp. CA-293567 TaxID=3002436 RepID=UPI0022DD27DC|nr:hypothetical protein [Kribbella sp. CA-293567]WBQ02083.1 hypothetical protein OX958_19020 [Kribbella sp. CA-293567]